MAKGTIQQPQTTTNTAHTPVYGPRLPVAGRAQPNYQQMYNQFGLPSLVPLLLGTGAKGSPPATTVAPAPAPASKGTAEPAPKGTASAAAPKATDSPAPAAAKPSLFDNILTGLGFTEYVVAPGDNPSKIAAAKLGDPARAADIMALNSITDPTRLQIGQTDFARAEFSPELLQQAARQALRRGLVGKDEISEGEVALRPFGGLAT